MKMAKVFSLFLLISLGMHTPLQAVNLGLKSKTIIGFFAAAGSAMATGAAHVVESFKRDSLQNTQERIAQLENELLGTKVKELCDMSFNDGLFFGAMAALTASAIILAIANSSTEEAKKVVIDKAEVDAVKS